MEAVVIAGSGLAGYSFAREFRRHDKATPLVIISRDDAAFYSKPMLSNALAGRKTAATLVTRSAAQMADDLQATVRPRTAIAAIDAASGRVVLDDGSELRYRDLVLALGADPIRMALDGDARDEVLSVNDLEDYARFAACIEGVQRVAILGAGLIGCEFANDLLARGISPMLVDPADRPLSRLLPAPAAARLRERLEAAGVSFRMGVTVSSVQRAGSALQLRLSDGSAVEAEVVLSAIGLRPRIAVAEAAGLAVQRGIVVDRLLRTSEPHVYALGDCAEVEGMVLPFVMPLMQQARALGATLAGMPTPVRYPAMPVLVKTPACPTVVCPPSPLLEGAWRTELSEGGCDARFHAPDGTLLGFAVLGAATSQKQALAAQITGALT